MLISEKSMMRRLRNSVLREVSKMWICFFSEHSYVLGSIASIKQCRFSKLWIFQNYNVVWHLNHTSNRMLNQAKLYKCVYFIIWVLICCFCPFRSFRLMECLSCHVHTLIIVCIVSSPCNVQQFFFLDLLTCIKKANSWKTE